MYANKMEKYVVDETQLLTEDPSDAAVVTLVDWQGNGVGITSFAGAWAEVADRSSHNKRCAVGMSAL